MGALNILEMPVGERRGFDVERAVRGTALGNTHAKAVLMVLASAVNAEGWCFLGSDRVEREADVEGETLRKVRRIFEAMGLVKHTRLTKAEMAELRREGKDGAFREEEWQLNLSMLGRDLRGEYERFRVQFNGKGARPADAPRGRVKPGPKVVAENDVAATENLFPDTKKVVAATNPPNPLYGRTTNEPEGTPTRAETAPQGVESRMLAVAATAVRAACGWKGLLVDREVMPACVEAMGDLCRELGCDASEASALVIEAWKLDQRSANPTLVPARWFGGPWRRWVDCVLAARAAEAKCKQVGMERRVELDAMLVECESEAVDAWRAVLARLERVVNRQSFTTWLRPTKGLRFDGGVLVVRVPTGQFMHLAQRYERELAEALSAAECGVSSVQFVA